MLNILKENSYVVVKMVLNQIGMTIFGFMLAMATANADENASSNILLLITSLFSILFYLSLLYMSIWDVGAKDKIRVDGGRAPYNPYKGFILSGAANLLNLVLGVLSVIGYYFTITFDPANPVWAANLYAVSNMIARLLQAMYLGVIQTVSPDNPLILILIIFPAIYTSALGYYLGLKDIRLLSFIGIKPRQNRKKRD